MKKKILEFIFGVSKQCKIVYYPGYLARNVYPILYRYISDSTELIQSTSTPEEKLSFNEVMENAHKLLDYKIIQN